MKKQPNIAVEVFLSLVKWFLIFIVINNLIWAGIYSYTLHKASSDIITSAEMLQDGANNNQRVTKHYRRHVITKASMMQEKTNGIKKGWQ